MLAESWSSFSLPPPPGWLWGYPISCSPDTGILSPLIKQLERKIDPSFPSLILKVIKCVGLYLHFFIYHQSLVFNTGTTFTFRT
jgi:hypothetical protein